MAMAAAAASLGMEEEQQKFADTMKKVTAALGEFTASIRKMQNVMLEAIAAYKPFQVELFTRRLKDLQAVLGVFLLPVLHTATRYVRMFADFVLSLTKPFKDVIQGLGRVGLVFTLLTFLGIPLVAVLSALAVVFAALSAVAIVLATVGLPVTIVLAAITIALAELAAVIAAVVAAITAVVYAFSQTKGGASFFEKALKGIGDVIETVWQVIRGVWDGLKPIRDAVAEAFSELGDSMSKLFDAMKPAIFDVIAVVILHVAAAFIALAAIITMIAKVIQAVVWVFRQLFGIFNAITGQERGVDLAERRRKSAFGLAAQGGQISSDVGAMKTKIEEQILAQTGREEGPTQEDMPKTVEEIRKFVEQIANFMLHPIASTAEAARSVDPTGLGDIGFEVGQWLRKQVVGN